MDSPADNDFVPQVFRAVDSGPPAQTPVPVTPASIGGDLDILSQLFQMPTLTKFSEILGNIKEIVAIQKGTVPAEKPVTLLSALDDEKAGVLVDQLLALLGKIPNNETMTVATLIIQLGQNKPMLTNALKEWIK